MKTSFISGSTYNVSAASCRREKGNQHRGGKMPPIRFAEVLDVLCREPSAEQFDGSRLRPVKKVSSQAIRLTAPGGNMPPEDFAADSCRKEGAHAYLNSAAHAMLRIVCWTTVFLSAIALSAPTAPPLSAAEQTTGPTKGILVIVGGGDKGHHCFEQFVDLAGGKDAKIVVIPTASSSDPEYDYSSNKTAAFAIDQLGVPDVTIVHTHDRSVADTAAFVKPIHEADGVWFSGGRQWRIADAYLGTLTEQELCGVLDRGGVIGGSSAGASIQGSFLVRGDTRGSHVLIGDHQQGLGYIRNSAIDQHVIPRKREQGLIEVLTDPDGRMDPDIDRQALLGIGIDEGTGIVVRGNEFEVIGRKEGVVLIYDPHHWQGKDPAYLTLGHGAKYNLHDRIVLDSGTSRPARTIESTEDQ